MARSYELSFDNADPAEANRMAGELQAHLNGVSPEIEATRKRADPQSMDLGTIIGIVASSGAVLELTRALSVWLKQRSSASITIRENGEVIATGVTSRDAMKILEKIRG